MEHSVTVDQAHTAEPAKSEARVRRKLEHVHWALHLRDGGGSGWDDVHLVHNCLPEVNLDEVRLETSLAGIALRVPLLINAMTGGAAEVQRINAQLAEAAAATGVAMAVGSQQAGLARAELEESYRVARRLNPDGVLFANVGAGTRPDDACRAVEMLRANALQVHLNAAQELIMAEGDRNLRGWLGNIEQLAKACDVPLIVKEVGTGMAREEVRRLRDAGAAVVDVGGRGGTSFVRIEAARRALRLSRGMRQWGIPAAVAVCEAVTVPGVQVVAAGGIRGGVEAAKALALGARVAGAARPLLQAVVNGGAAAAIRLLQDWLQELRWATALAGVRDVTALARRPVVVLGRTAEWLRARGIDPAPWARRCPPAVACEVRAP